ncbi:uncharacterized protein LOC115622657 [Scaptodrosophila lebanonensis]|uniref:Uncharacterized protein LOC115622657 n=1 Tax=Drosophila lebanonensis TaxID=7225 RepID=A0A6J2TB03_DROLE|nr:uncharacterized protein LOC115622657 [Scaptodrosophila lebanonensis]XP_030372540.1 uncharacterized protein LOC115622657 [Scaptodrosophila lebanonensis]
MPCETCRVEFTVFRRKRSCFDCRRYYCNNCLTATKRCQRCAIFAKRPLLRTDLLKLKPKDLIFFLQSKHISTEGCLEKEELVGLVMNHVAQIDRDSFCSPNSPNSPGRGQSNPIDNLKQTCQNFFTNLSDNLSDSFASFDTKPTSKAEGNSRANSRHTSNDNGPSHIFEQPRVSTREIPTYASATNTSFFAAPVSNTSAERVHVHVSDLSNSSSNTPTTSSAAATPNTLTSPTTAQAATSGNPATTTHNGAEAAKHKNNDLDGSDCECSDDEIIATFSERLSLKTDNSGQVSLSKPPAEPNSAGLGPSTTTTTNTSPGYSKHGSLSSKVDACGADVSSQSSFEELGAIGGISDESKAATDTNSSNLDQWQVLEVGRNEHIDTSAAAADAPHLSLNIPTENGPEEILEVTVRAGEQGQTSTQTLNIEQRNVPSGSVYQQSSYADAPHGRTKKVIRRRSDGCLNRRHHSSDDESPVAIQNIVLATLSEQPEAGTLAETQENRNSCQRCGKNKTSIKRHVERMRRHLESSQMSEEDIKRELQEFLCYLEQRTKSVDCSDAESHALSPLSVEIDSVAGSGAGARGSALGMPITPTIEFSPTNDDSHWDDDEGIHVYAAPLGFEPSACIDSRFINLQDFEDIKDLENLTVKQLKEVLMLHRVDYKGCCEKQELLDRVTRLWKNMHSTPAVEKLPTDELCKICMDAPIECVFLECGHMATCTSCGKQCPECPICRQYVVRVVRFFRA